MTDSLPELQVLGCVLDNPAACLPKLEGITPRHFNAIGCQRLFQAILNAQADGYADDPARLMAHVLKAQEPFGGMEFIRKCLEQVISAAGFETYLEQVRDAHSKRTIKAVLEHTVALANEPGADAGQIARDAANALQSLADAKAPDLNAWPEITSFADLADDPAITTPPEVIDGLLHKGCKMIVGGSSKSKKTWTLIDLAVSVAAGVSFWNWQTHQGRVLYVNFEILPGFIKQRVTAVLNSKGLSTNDIQLDLWNLRGHAADAGAVIPKLVQAIRENSYVVVIVDPIYKLSAGQDENSAGAMGFLVNQLEQIPAQTGAALVYAHHFSKGNQAGKDSIDRISGSGVFARDCDTLLTLTKHEQDGAFTVESVLRNHPEQAPFVVEWHHPVFASRDDLDPSRLKQVKPGRSKEYDPQDVLNLLPDSGLTSSAWAKVAREECGISERSFHRLKKALVDGGEIIQSKVNSAWIKA